jgi:cell division protein FtsW (lipid II flippase)
VSSITAPSPAVDPDSPLIPASRSRRRTELTMLIFAFALVAFAFANVGYSLQGKLPASLAEYLGAFVVITVAGHLAVRRLAPWADPLLLPLAALLNGLGIVMTYRLAQQGNLLSAPLSSSATAIQVVYTAIGVGCFAAVLLLVREPRVLQRYTYTLGAIGLGLLALPALLPASISEVYGAKIQIRLGTFTVQPEEFAKLALAVSFAGYLVAKRDVLALAGRRVLGIDLPRARDLGPILVIWVASLLLLVFESDIGTSAVFMGLFVAML